MADLQQILTAAINLVQATNALGQTYLSVQGAKNMANITTPVVVLNAPGRIAAVSVTTVGANGTIYDSTNALAPLRPIYVIEGNVTGIQTVNLPVSYGIVAAPGAGSAITVSYSPIVTPT